MVPLRVCASFLLATTAILLAAMLAPRGAAEDLPPLDVLAPRQYEWTNNTTLMVTGITAPNATVEVTVHSSSGNRSYTGSAREDGTFSVQVELYLSIQDVIITVTDALDRSSTVTRDVTCDTEPPPIKISRPPVSPFSTNMTHYKIVVLNLCECDIWVTIGDFGEEYICGAANRTVDLVEGENRIRVMARDKLWNEVVMWVVIIVDSTPPQLNVTAPTGTALFTNSSGITLAGNASGGGPVLVEVDGTVGTAALRRGDWSTGAAWEQYVYLGPVEGTWRIEVRTSDAVGNVAKRWIDVTLDWTPPDILLDLETSTRVPRVQVEGMTEEGIDEALIDGVPFSVVHGMFSTIIMPLEHGWNHILVQVHDLAWNWAIRDAWVFYSARPPVLHLLDPERFGDDGVRIRGTTDTYVEQVLIDGWSYPVTNGNFLVELNDTRGENEFEVTVVDPAGTTTDGRALVMNETPGLGLPALAIAMVLVTVMGLVLVAVLYRRRRWRTGSP